MTQRGKENEVLDGFLALGFLLRDLWFQRRHPKVGGDV
jgi:hypothetical protein